MEYNTETKTTSFEINYKKETVKFTKDIFMKKKMSLNEFAISVLQIEPISTEIIAMYIGKLDFDVYNDRGDFQIMISKKTPKGIKGKIKIDQRQIK